MIERAGPNDLMQLATDVGPVPMHIAAIVLLDPGIGFDLDTAVVLVGQRLGRIPRLRRRLVRPPIGCGPAYWLDDATFDPSHHIQVTECPCPGDESALLDTALALAATTLPRSRPMWSATFVTGLARGRVALVLVMHHVVADGLGALAVIGELVDDGSAPLTAPQTRFPRPVPSRRALAIDAWTTRLHAISELPGRLPQLIPAVAELRTVRRRWAPRTSLNRPTGPRRQARLARTDLAAALNAAHAQGGTVNDVILTAVVGAVGDLLEARGETVRRLIVSVPVSSRSPGDRVQIGNHVGVMLTALPVGGDPLALLKAVVGITRDQKKRRRPEASATLLQPAFRALGRVGILSWCINHQRLVNTFVTNVPGPKLPVTFMDARVTDVIPIAGAAGNATVAFAVLSYDGVLTVTVVADPDAVPELQQLTASLQRELDALTSPHSTT